MKLALIMLDEHLYACYFTNASDDLSKMREYLNKNYPSQNWKVKNYGDD